MKNTTKQTLTSTVLAISLLAGHSFIKDSSAQSVNAILCNKTGITEIKHGNITIYNTEGCFIRDDNTRFFDELAKVEKANRFKEMVAYPLYGKSTWKNNMIIKIDGTADGTMWTSDWYFYDSKSGTLKNTKAPDLDNAIAKIDSGLIK